MAPGSQTFEQDLIRLVKAGIVTRDEAMDYSDSPANLMWQLQNQAEPVEADADVVPPADRIAQPPVFTDFVVEVREQAAELPVIPRPQRAGA